MNRVVFDPVRSLLVALYRWSILVEMGFGDHVELLGADKVEAKAGRVFDSEERQMIFPYRARVASGVYFLGGVGEVFKSFPVGELQWVMTRAERREGTLVELTELFTSDLYLVVLWAFCCAKTGVAKSIAGSTRSARRFFIIAFLQDDGPKQL
jgi:hypothetical protein